MRAWRCPQRLASSTRGAEPRASSAGPKANLSGRATTHELEAGTAWHGAGDAVLLADAPAVLLGFELIDAARLGRCDAVGGESRPLLEQAIELDPARGWLMRCDRVDFAPGGVALPHGHKGGGIRCLLAGTLEVTVGDRGAAN